MGAYSQCVACGRKLRDAFFCRRCNHAACSFRCLDAHAALHEHGTGLEHLGGIADSRAMRLTISADTDGGPLTPA